MNKKDLFNAVTDVPDELVNEAKNTRLKHWLPWQKLTALAAATAVLLGVVFGLPYFVGSSGGALLDVVFPKAYAFNDISARKAVMEENPVADDFLASLNEFSYKTASQIFADRTGNTNYSPVSLYFALAMAASGAEGKTSYELLSLLGVPSRAALSTQCGNLYRQLYKNNSIGKLKIANSLWMDDQIIWKDSFIKNAAENFYARSFSVDFSNEKTGKSMAKWISENTNNTLAPEITPVPEQILSILNTVYYYDEWSNRFEKSKTAKGDFYLSADEAVSTDFMNSVKLGGFAKGEDFTRSSLNLKNGGEMVFVLPKEGVSPQELLSSAEKMRTVFEEGQEGHGEIVWQIPKFSFGSKLELVNTLKSLGVYSAFEGNADFSGITDQTAFISGVTQETHIGVDENGVEASAYTQISFMGAAMPEDKAEMILNRPFVYGIVAPNDTLLFVGICNNPTIK